MLLSIAIQFAIAVVAWPVASRLDRRLSTLRLPRRRPTVANRLLVADVRAIDGILSGRGKR